jgi:aminoglycoside phosphotransferase (APT) family kinase protein
VDPIEVLAELLGDAGGLRFATGPTHLDAGRSADLYTFRLADGPPDLVDRGLVLRVLPRSARSMRECALQAGLADAGYPTPQVLRYGAVAGRPGAMVMEQVDGVELFEALGAKRSFRELPGRLANLLLALHAVDPTSVATGGGDLGEQALSEIDEWLATIGHPARQELGDWFARNRPPPQPGVVCHGDLHAFNILMAGDQEIVLDWEMGGIAHPAFDVARTRIMMLGVPMPIPRPIRPIIEGLGRRSARQLEDRYLAGRDIPEPTLRWYEAIHCARIVAMLLVGGSGSGASEAVIEGWRPAQRTLTARLEEITDVRLRTK